MFIFDFKTHSRGLERDPPPFQNMSKDHNMCVVCNFDDHSETESLVQKACHCRV